MDDPPRADVPSKDDGDDDWHRTSLRSIRMIEVRRDCPYLHTVNRQVLDFERPKFCSVSLTKFSVYACLVCGEYFHGRGRTTCAFQHSLMSDHHLFINLYTQKIYCLPDEYEIVHSDLDDIPRLLDPRFGMQDLHIADTPH